jgi:formate dehydrogenase iron-sulfur subunit
MSGKSFLVDLTKCTACRGCQVACKQWNGLPAEQTRNWGSHQNPKDLSYNTYKVVRFEETVVKGALNWLFMPEQCRHCVEPPCMAAAEGADPQAIVRDHMTGAVLFTDRTAKLNFQEIKEACPYNIPRQDPKTKKLSKCTMCIDRVYDGLLPACVLSCPTGAMAFGDRDEMLALAAKRLAAAKKKYPDALLVNAEDVRVIYLCAVDPKLYYKFMLVDASGSLPGYTRKEALATLLKPLRSLTSV